MIVNGWIKISRDIVDMKGYFGERFSRAMCWIDLLILAEWKERTFFIRGNEVHLSRGQIAISISELSNRWSMSVNTVQKRLCEFVADDKISIRKSQIVNIITVVNYEKYQSIEIRCDIQNSAKSDIQTDIQTASKSDIQKVNTSNLKSNSYKDEQKNSDIQTDMQIEHKSDIQTDIQTDIPIKNIKNNIYKEDIDKSISKKENFRFLPPKVDEVRKYIIEKGYDVDAETFVNFYEAKGWMIGKNKMKNWHAAIATWQKSNSRYGINKKTSSTVYDRAQGATAIINRLAAQEK